MPPTTTSSVRKQPTGGGRGQNEETAKKKKLEKEKQGAKKLLDDADQLLAQTEESYFLMSIENPREYPTFDRNELGFGPILGVGGFGIVFEIQDLSLNVPSEVSITSNHEDDDELAQHTLDHTDSLLEEQSNATTTTETAALPQSLDESQTTATTNGGITTTTSTLAPSLLGAAASTAHIVTSPVCQDDSHYDIQNARQYMAQHLGRKGHARYAVKRLHHDLSDLERARGMIDLAIEAKFLSALWHPSIIKMRGMASGPMLSRDFFIVMDRLYGTLADEMKRWKEKHSLIKGKFFGMGADKVQMKELLLERLLVAYDLAAAFWFMHEKKLVYRDTKQENIGFDIRGDVKIFDFGLPKGLSPALKSEDSYGYKLTARTGSVPYMAPEVVDCKPYDCKSDVFSFSILLWEMLALKTAFKGYTRREFLEKVVRAKERLPINKKWTPLTRVMIKEAWDADPRKRPDMKRVAVMLRGDLNDMSDDSTVRDRTQHMRDRSSHSTRMSRMGRGMTNSFIKRGKQ